MTKIIKILGRTIGILVEWLILLLILFAFAIRTSPVQTYLAEVATDFLSKEMNASFKIDKLDIVFIDRIALDGVLLIDPNKDTLANIGRIYVTLDDYSLKHKYVILDKAELVDGNVHLFKNKETRNFNFQFIVDYFKSDEKPTKSEPFRLGLNNLQLSNVHFKYDDYFYEQTKFGVDYQHLDLKNLNLSATNIKLSQGNIRLNLSELSTKEHSGFDLDNLCAKVWVNEKGIRLDDLTIVTPKSHIEAKKMHLLYKSYADFSHFVDQVDFDVQLNKSIVSLQDISYFATALEGMDQTLGLQGKVSSKVKDLKLRDFELTTGNRTKIAGNFNLPDFRNLDAAFFQEKINYAYIDFNDLQKIKLPKSSSTSSIQLDAYSKRLGFVEARDLRLDGFFQQFVISADIVNTALGAVKMDNGILFSQNKQNNSLLFERSEASTYDVKVENFDLGKFLGDPNFGLVDGTFFLTGEAFSSSDIHFNSLQGDVNRFDYLNYSYKNIHLIEGSLIDNILLAKLDIKDDNLDLTYDGRIELNGQKNMNLDVQINHAFLNKLNLTSTDSTYFQSNFHVNIYGTDPNTMYGDVTTGKIIYKEGEKEIVIPSLSISVSRAEENDHFNIQSEIGTLDLKGEIDFGTIATDFMEQLDKVFPGILALQKVDPKRIKHHNHFTYDFVSNKTDDFLSIFMPELSIKPGSKLKGEYIGEENFFTMDLSSEQISYGDFKLKGVDFKQQMTNEEAIVNYKLNQFSYGDSIHIEQVHFKTLGKNNVLFSDLSWNPNSINESEIQWKTNIVDRNQLNIELSPSYFALNEMRWDIEKQSDIAITTEDLHISKFKLSRGKQYISVDGCISKNDNDKLNLKVSEIDLTEVSDMLGIPMEMEGIVNGWGYISNPFTNFKYMGDASIIGLYLNKQEVGDVFVQSEWNQQSQSIAMEGDLKYRGNETFNFLGNYHTAKKEDNLDIYLVFDHTDIKFANAFLDPDVIKDIAGELNGNLKIKGSPDEPKLEGRLDLSQGNTHVSMLGVDFGFNGQVIVDEYGFYINNMPLKDELGNTGYVIGSVYHENFADWNFDVQINLEGKETNENTAFQWAPTSDLPERFLLMNTQYKEGDIYYGKAYGAGNVNIFGYSDQIEITVDIKTKRGTEINFPMYGQSELKDEEGFIKFIEKGAAVQITEPKIDFTGVELDLNFRVTPEAKMKLIFNEQTGDEINASGSGTIAMKMDNLGDLKLDGTYKIKDGVYNFAMGPIKQPFFIQEGGSITWTGDPFNAQLDLKTFYKVNANISEISPNELQGTSNNNDQEIQCFLNLTETLLNPAISFNIGAPKANETEKSLISRIISDPDELNRQFFSLLLWRKFQPLKGTTAASGSGALDLVSNQINSLLSMVSKEYKLNVNLDADDATGENTMEFGIQKGFLDDRLVVRGSFGVETGNGTTTQNTNQLIGDVSVDYLLNQSGTIRINIFNESNDNTAIQDKNLGLFTQGAGLNYQEDFDTFENFMLGQTVADIFRKKENKKIKIKRKKRQTPVPK